MRRPEYGEYQDKFVPFRIWTHLKWKEQHLHHLVVKLFGFRTSNFVLPPTKTRGARNVCKEAKQELFRFDIILSLIVKWYFWRKVHWPLVKRRNMFSSTSTRATRRRNLLRLDRSFPESRTRNASFILLVLPRLKITIRVFMSRTQRLLLLLNS